MQASTKCGLYCVVVNKDIRRFSPCDGGGSKIIMFISSMMEKSESCEGHNHIVAVGSLDNVVVSY